MRYYNKNLIILSGLYLHISFLYKTDKKKISKGTEKKIREYIGEIYYNSELPSELSGRLGQDKSIESIMKFLAGCNKKLEAEVEEKNREEALILSEFDDDVKEAFEAIDSTGLILDVKAYENDVHIVFEEVCSCIRTLVLHCNAPDKNSVKDLQEVFIDWHEIEKTDDGYCFEFISEQTGETVSVAFDRAEVKNQVFNGLSVSSVENPWEMLIMLAYQIYRKSQISDLMLNQQERKLIPLVAFLWALELHSEEKFDKSGTELFCKLAKKHQFDEIESLTVKMVSAIDERKRRRYSCLLLGKLCEQKYEPLWREIFNMLSRSQEGYFSKAEALYGKDKLDEIRKSITKVMRENGYGGEYPDFYKSDCFNGIKTVESYNQLYFVLKHKNTKYHIKCFERFENSELNVDFLCGTAFLTKNEMKSDKNINVYSCLFNANGKKLFRIFSAFLPDDKCEYDSELPDIDDFARVAVKRTELCKLSKDERNNMYLNSGTLGCLEAVLMFVFMGTLFGLWMTVGFMFIELVAALLVTRSFSEFWNLFLETPWWMIFLFTSVAFGGFMTAFYAIVRKN